MKLDKIITTALGASSVANGLPILDNKDHGNELGKIPALENRSGIEHLHDEIHPHKIRHSRDTNEMNQHQHQEHLGEMQDDDPKNPYYAQRPKRADILTSTDEERERQYNRANESLSRIERDYKDMMERFNPSYRILNFNYYKSLQEIKSIANSLKRERSYDEISDRSKTQMNKLADLYDQAKTIYEDGKDNPSYKSPENEHMRERYNNFLPSLEEVEEIVGSYRKIAAKDSLVVAPTNRIDQLLDEIEEQFKEIHKSNPIPLELKNTLKKMEVITNNLKKDASFNTPNWQYQLNRIDTCLTKAKTMHNELSRDIRSTEQIKEIDSLLDRNEEVIAYLRNDQIESVDSRYSYYPNYEKRHQELLSALEKTTNTINNLSFRLLESLDRSYLLKSRGSYGLTSSEATIAELKDIELNQIPNAERAKDKIKSDILHERDSIVWFSQNEKIIFIEEATNYINKYDELIKGFDHKREKRNVSHQQNLSEKLANIATKVQENYTDKPLPSNVKQNTAIGR